MKKEMCTLSKVSFIVPVYNMENTIRNCINSILKQSMENIEVILIDDGSTDESGKICDEYAKNDNRVIVVHKENGGIADAMNAGLEIMTGDYILFVDSDDYVDARMAEIMLDRLLQENVDIVQCGYTIHTLGGKEVRRTRSIRTCISGNERVVESYFLYKGIGGNLSAKLFKAELFSGIRMPKGRMFADVPIIPYILHRCKKYLIIGEPFYHVTANPQSASRGTLNEKKYSDIQYNLETVTEFIKKYYPIMQYHVFYLKASTIAFNYEKIRNSNELKNVVGNMKALKHDFKVNFRLLHSSGEIKQYPLLRRMQLYLFNINPNLYIYMEKVYRIFKVQ